DYWDISSSGTTAAAGTPTSISGVTGLSSAQMVTPSSFTGFNFTYPVWVQYAGHTQPLLNAFMIPLTITVPAASITYSGSSDPVTLAGTGATFSVTGASSSPNLLNAATPYSGDINVGAYTPSLWSDQQGYNLNVVGGTLTIAPATLTYTANTVSQFYGSAIPALSGNISGFVGSDTLANATTGTMSFATLATQASNVGRYAIDGSGLSANHGNYVFQQATGNATALTVFPVALSAASHVTKTYDGTTRAALDGSNTTLSGFVLGQNATVNGNATGTFSSANVGTGLTITGGALTTTDLTAASGTLLSNYLMPLSDNGHGTITPALLTYGSSTRTFLTGQTPSGLSGSLSGFVAGQTLSSATTGTASWTTPATAASAPGQYAIDGAGLTANLGNYSFQQASANATALTLSPGTIAGLAAAVPGLAPLPVAIHAADATAPVVVQNPAGRAGIAHVRVINGGVRLPATLWVSQNQEAH
ncbi:MAG: MBG domain-containing protein, partial [Acidiferrobacteraceae bacterium]